MTILPDFMRPLAASVSSAILAALLLAAAAPALAVCPTIQSTVDTLAPAAGVTGVPLNADIAFGTSPSFASYDPLVVLTSSSGGAAIPGALLSGPAGSWLFSPDVPLQPSRTYSVSVTDAAGEGAPASTSFTTGTGTDTTDPAIAGVPVLTLDGYTDPVRTDECQQPGYWNVHVDWEDASDASPVIYALDVRIVDLIPQDFAPRARPATATAVALTSAVSERVISVPGDSEVTVAVYAIDAAGRQGHSADGVFNTPPAPVNGGGGGCACEIASVDGDYDAKTTGGILGAIVAILMLAAVSLVMRRVLRE